MLMPDNTVFVPVQNPNMTGERTKNVRLSMAQRLSTFEEVEKTYTEEEALREASRCLGCPRRWCSGECPAGMPVPEFIKKIREKVELDTAKPQYIETIWGVGYRFKV